MLSAGGALANEGPPAPLAATGKGAAAARGGAGGGAAPAGGANAAAGAPRPGALSATAPTPSSPFARLFAGPRLLSSRASPAGAWANATDGDGRGVAGAVTYPSGAAVFAGSAAATEGTGVAGAGVPSSVTVISALAGARDDLPRKSSTLVPIMTRNTAAMAVCGRIAQLPASDTARASR